MNLNVPIHTAAHAIQMNALMCAIPASDMAKLTSDA
jgi:hypothetical protein